MQSLGVFEISAPNNISSALPLNFSQPPIQPVPLQKHLVLHRSFGKILSQFSCTSKLNCLLLSCLINHPSLQTVHPKSACCESGVARERVFLSKGALSNLSIAFQARTNFSDTVLVGLSSHCSHKKQNKQLVCGV